MPTEALHELYERLELTNAALLEFQVLHTRHANLARQRSARVALLERSRHARPRPMSVQALIGHERLDAVRRGGDDDDDDAAAAHLYDEDADNHLAAKLGHNRFLVESDVTLAALNGARDALLHALVGVRWAAAQRSTTKQTAAQLAHFVDALSGGCDRVQALLTTWQAGLQATIERRVATRDLKQEHAETGVLLTPARFVSHRSSLPEMMFEFEDYASALRERDLTCALARAVGELCAQQSDGERRCVAAQLLELCGADLQAQLTAFVDQVMQRTGRSVLDCVPYQALAWWLAHTAEHPLPLAALRGLLCEMQSSHARHVAEELAMTVPLVGFASLHHGTVTRQAVHLLSHVLSLTPLADRRPPPTHRAARRSGTVRQPRLVCGARQRARVGCGARAVGVRRRRRRDVGVL
jgi:hypothetical protein